MKRLSLLIVGISLFGSLALSQEKSAAPGKKLGNAVIREREFKIKIEDCEKTYQVAAYGTGACRVELMASPNALRFTPTLSSYEPNTVYSPEHQSTGEYRFSSFNLPVSGSVGLDVMVTSFIRGYTIAVRSSQTGQDPEKLSFANVKPAIEEAISKIKDQKIKIHYLTVD